MDMSTGLRNHEVSQLMIANGRWSGKQLTKYIATGQLGEQETRDKSEKYSQSEVRKLVGG